MKRFGVTVLGAIVASSVSGPAFSAELDKAIRGTWKGPHVENCQALRDQTADDYIIFGKKGFERHEGKCVITKYSREAKTHSLKFLCETEGETVRGDMKVTVLNADRISIAGAGQYERCK
jgi:hypothetical protein